MSNVFGKGCSEWSALTATCCKVTTVQKIFMSQFTRPSLNPEISIQRKQKRQDDEGKSELRDSLNFTILTSVDSCLMESAVVRQGIFEMRRPVLFKELYRSF